MTSTDFHPEPPGMSKHAKRALARGLRLMILNGMNLDGSAQRQAGTHKWWNHNVENMYRCQVAGYRDENQYLQRRKLKEVDKWPETGLIRKLVRWDGKYYYFGEDRECPNLTSSDVKKALLRQTVIFEKSPFTNGNLRWAPVLSRMTQKFNEAFDEVVNKNPRPQKTRMTKPIEEACEIPKITTTLQKSKKIKSPKLVSKINTGSKKPKKRKCAKTLKLPKTHCPQRINKKKHTCKGPVRLSSPRAKVSSFRMKTEKDFENLEINKSKSKTSTPRFKSSFKYDMNNTCFRNRIVAIRNKYKLDEHPETNCDNSAEKPDTSLGDKENCSTSSIHLVNKTGTKRTKEELDKIIILRKKCPGKRKGPKVEYRLKGKNALKYWFPEISTRSSEEEPNGTQTGRDTSSSDFCTTEMKAVTQSGSLGKFQNYDYMMNINSQFDEFRQVGEGNKFCYRKAASGDISPKVLRSYNINTSQSNPNSIIKCDSNPTSLSTNNENTNLYKNRKPKGRSKVYLTKIDVHSCDSFGSPGLSATSSKLNSCSTVLDLSMLTKPDNTIIDRKQNNSKLVPKHSMGDVPQNRVKIIDKSSKLSNERVAITQRSVVRINRPEACFPVNRMDEIEFGKNLKKCLKSDDAVTVHLKGEADKSEDAILKRNKPTSYKSSTVCSNAVNIVGRSVARHGRNTDPHIRSRSDIKLRL